MIRNIIFDWSGTLVDDLPAVWKATNYVLTRAELDSKRSVLPQETVAREALFTIARAARR